MDSHPKIAVVILNWNGIQLFDRFLPSVINHSGNADIYVADNGSTDGSPEYLSTNFPKVKLIVLDRNYGFAGGYNQALQQVDADIYVLINSDLEVTPGWLEPCVRRLLENPRTAAVQPKIRSYSDRGKFEYAGAAGGYIDKWGFPFCRGRILSEVENDSGQYDQPVSLFWATGACMLVRSSAFREAGGFDEDFFAHMEEIDLCWRLKNRGWSIQVEPSSTVYHLGGATLSYQSPQKVYLNFRNSLWMMLKNLPKGKLLRFMIPRLILDGVATMNFLVSGQFYAFRAVWRAHMAFYKTLPRFLGKRADNLSHVKTNSHPEIFSGSMVYRFYILKQKKFSLFKFRK